MVRAAGVWGRWERGRPSRAEPGRAGPSRAEPRRPFAVISLGVGGWDEQILSRRIAGTAGVPILFRISNSISAVMMFDIILAAFEINHATRSLTSIPVPNLRCNLLFSFYAEELTLYNRLNMQLFGLPPPPSDASLYP